MTITLTPDIEQALTKRAERQGTTPELLTLRDLRSLYAPETSARAKMEQLWSEMPQTEDIVHAEQEILAETQAARHGQRIPKDQRPC